MAAVVSIIIPALDEAATVGDVLAGIGGIRSQLPDTELILVDDGSTDTTHEIAEASGEVDRVLRHETSQGKGAAVSLGMENAAGAVVVIIDADHEYLPEDIPAVVAPILNDEADVVYGSRYLSGGEVARGYRRFGNRVLTAFSNLLTGQTLTDMETGLKAFRAELLAGEPITERSFGFEPEVTAKLSAAGGRFAEVPITYRPRGYAEGKKIRLRDGFIALWVIWKFRKKRPR